MNSVRYKWYLVGMLWWISFFNYADRQAIFSVFPKLHEEMGLDEVELGQLGSAFAWVYGLSAPFAGALVDRVRRKTAILGGLQIWSVICLATALSRKFWHLIFFRAAEGLGETFYYPASVSLISDYHPPQTRSRALGLHQTSVYAGTIGGGFLAGLIAQHYDWRASFVVFGTSGIVLGLLLQRFIQEAKRGASDPGSQESAKLSFGETVLLVIRTPAVLFLMLGFMFANFVAMVLLSWMPYYLKENFHLSLALAGLSATAFPQLASLCGAVGGGWLADRLRVRNRAGRVLVQSLGVLGGAPFVFLSGQTQSVLWVLAFLSAWGFFKGIYDANIFASVFDLVPPSARGTVAGFMNMVGWVAGGAPAPWVVGEIASRHGLALAISSTAVVYLAAFAVLALAAVMIGRRPVEVVVKADRGGNREVLA